MGFTWWVDGELVAAADATLPVADHGLTVGDGCFETTSIVRGEAFAMTRHLARLRRSLAGLRIDLSLGDDELRSATRAVVEANPEAGIIRITVTAGTGPLGSGRGDGTPTVIVAAGPGRGWADTAAVITVEWPRNERGALAGIKSTSYADNVLALARARDAGASEAIFPNTVGNLCEGTGTNVFLEYEGRLITPPLSAGCLAGVTRDLVLELTDACEIDVPIEVLGTTSEAFLTSSTRDVMAIDRVDGRSLGTGPLTQEAARAFVDLVERTLDP